MKKKEGYCMTFGDQLTKARKEKMFTQEQLAEELNLSRQTILRWEKNQVFPDISNLKAVTQVLDVSFDYLLGETETSHAGKKPTSLLSTLINKQVKIVFFEDAQENYLEVYGKTCRVLDVEDDIIQVQLTLNKELVMKIISLSAIRLFTLVEEGGM